MRRGRRRRKRKRCEEGEEDKKANKVIVLWHFHTCIAEKSITTKTDFFMMTWN
jgi:hypothetical protein